MVPALVCLAAVLITLWRISRPRRNPLDHEEMRILRHFAEHDRREQFHRFE
jgi:hypothetical protein